MPRSIFHILLGILLWILFGYYWWLVVQRPITQHTHYALIAVGAITAGITLFLIGWVFHNTRIARRLKRRNSRVSGMPGVTVDFLGRRLVIADEGRLKQSGYIEVQVEERKEGNDVIREKFFRIIDKPAQS